MRYVPPFEMLRSLLTLTNIRGRLMASSSYDDILALIRSLLEAIELDEAWYLRRYPDIADAIAAGTIPSAKEHFLSNGYFEGRLPFPIVVDDNWYLEQNPGVAEAVRDGVFESAQRHFEDHGYLEGRKPFRM